MSCYNVVLIDFVDFTVTYSFNLVKSSVENLI